jgi:hypothetical protein
MAKPFTEWTVLPHGRLTRIDDNILSVTGNLRMPPMGQVERRMTAVRLNDGRLVIYSAIALREAEMSALERFGTPAFLIVPNPIHRLDAKAWKDHYPNLFVIAPAGARARVEKVVPVDATVADFGDPAVHFVTVPGTGDQEAALIVETQNGTTLIVSDLIFNLKDRPGVLGWFFKRIGMTGDEPRLPPVVKARLVKDEPLLRAQLERWAQLPNLSRIVIAHGNIIANDAPQVLNRVARSLAA